MAEKVLKDCKLLVGGYDLSGNSNSVTVTVSADVLDKTGFGSSFRKKIHGLKSVEMTGSGFWDSSTDPATKLGGFDKRLYNEVGGSSIGGSSQVITVATDDASSSPALITRGVGASYNWGGSVGDLMGFDFAAQGNANAVWGKLARVSTFGSSGEGQAVYLGTASTSTKKFYAAVHVIRGCSGAAQTMDLQIQMDTASNFSSPTTVCGITQLKTTDHHVRISWAATKASTESGYYRLIWKGSAAAVNMRAVVAIGKDKG